MTNSVQIRILSSVGVGLAVLLISTLSYLIYKRKKREIIPTIWKKVGTLQNLYLIPIKACAPIKLDEGQCETIGIRMGNIMDRALMVIEDSGQVVTARTYPKMFKISPRIVSSTKLVISAPGMEDLYFDYSALNDKPTGYTKALIYGAYVNVLNCGSDCSKWFSQFILGQSVGLRLVYYPHTTAKRPIRHYYPEGIYMKQDTGTFHDMSCYNLINNVSVRDLNTRLKDKVPLLQFRSNFYIENSGPAYDEDHWQWIKIGDEVIFRNIGPCYRCIVPNISPITAESHPDNEPLQTLKKYRVPPGVKHGLPVMGIQMGLRAQGTLKRGDDVYVAEPIL